MLLLLLFLNQAVSDPTESVNNTLYALGKSSKIGIIPNSVNITEFNLGLGSFLQLRKLRHSLPKPDLHGSEAVPGALVF